MIYDLYEQHEIRFSNFFIFSELFTVIGKRERDREREREKKRKQL